MVTALDLLTAHCAQRQMHIAVATPVFQDRHLSGIRPEDHNFLPDDLLSKRIFLTQFALETGNIPLVPDHS